MKKKQADDILWRFYNNLSNRQEKEAVERWYSYIEKNGENNYTENEIVYAGERLKNSILAEIETPVTKLSQKRTYFISSIVAAAGMLLFVLFNKGEHQAPVLEAATDKAILTIGANDPIDLNTLRVGESIDITSVHITKTKDGEIVYKANAESKDNNINVLQVPKGGKFKVLLPDGSQVWLNAESELHYPSQFTTTDRTISLKGEAFFDVAHDESKPFIINTSRADIRVLGTKFNIQAYDNESEWTTSVRQGKVRVSNHTNTVILNKDEQANISSNGTLKHTTIANPKVFAWHDGSFHFTGTNIQEIARQVERWYDIEVEIDPRVKNQEFYGIISRQESANQLFEILDATNTIKTTITKEKIKIYPKNNN